MCLFRNSCIKYKPICSVESDRSGVAWGEGGVGKEFQKDTRKFGGLMNLFTLLATVYEGVRMSKLIKLCSINICSLLCIN